MLRHALHLHPRAARGHRDAPAEVGGEVRRLAQSAREGSLREAEKTRFEKAGLRKQRAFLLALQQSRPPFLPSALFARSLALSASFQSSCCWSLQFSLSLSIPSDDTVVSFCFCFASLSTSFLFSLREAWRTFRFPFCVRR